jgi:hypothetical protein
MKMLAFLAFMCAGPVQAGCLIFCDAGLISPTDARAALEAELGAALPAGVNVVSMLEGGFQDAFIEVELTGTVEGGNALLAMMRIDPAQLPPMTGEGFGATATPAWSLRNEAALRGAEGWLGHFAVARAAVSTAPDADGLMRIFIFAFET